MIDLHLHTDMSDGSDSPLELLERIERAGCEVFSVTDHDDLRANAVILQAMKEKKYAARFITGCEISSVFEGRNLHLLCYGFDPEAESIKKMIAEGAKLRRQRIIAMFDHLCLEHNIIIPDEDKAEILSRAIPGKVHITDAAMNLGIKMTRQEFFDNCLDDMESREYKLTAEKVVTAVAEAGGVVSFAHPIEVQREYKINVSEIATMTKRLKAVGLTGIEVYHSSHGKKEVEAYQKIAKEHGLFVSGGSDYHGKNKDGVIIGKLNNYSFVPKNEDITIIAKLNHIKYLFLALQVATKAHTGQKDKVGVDYIRHPITVSAYCKTDYGKIAALLHDVVEDTEITLKDLRTNGFDEIIIGAVDCLTKRNGEDLKEYYNRMTYHGAPIFDVLIDHDKRENYPAPGDIALEVKFADMRHNSDTSRWPKGKEKEAQANRQKYFERAKMLRQDAGSVWAKHVMTAETYAYFGFDEEDKESGN